MWIKFAMALIPIIWLIISLGVMRMPAARACIIGLVLTILLAIFSFKLSVPNTLTAALEGIIMGICANYVRHCGRVICVQCNY